MTLTSVATLTRRTIAFSIIFAILATLAFIGYRIWYANYLAHLPPVEEKPDNRFGTLPIPEFPQTKVSSSNFSYSLDTVTGNLPTFPKIIKVYFMPKVVTTLLSSQKAGQLAQKLGFTNQPQVLSETNYQYTTNQKTLNMQINTGNFKYFLLNPQSTTSATLDNEDTMVDNFKSTLLALGLPNITWENSTSKIKYLKFDGNKIATASGREDAQIAQISLWPKDIDNKPLITGDLNKSWINTQVTGPANKLENYLSINYTFWSVDTSESATYYLKSSQDALNDLKSGKGAVILPPQDPTVSLTSVYLAYYQPEDYTSYLLPLYVFEGPSFVALVDAIKR